MAEPETNELHIEPALRWTGLLVWLGLVVACSLSSIYIVLNITQGTALSGFASLGPQDPEVERTIAFFAFVLSAAAAAALLAAWYTVGLAAHHLIDDSVNGGGVEGAGAPVGWLRGSGATPLSLPGTTAIFLGVTWAILLVMSPLLALIRAFLQD